MSGLFSCMIKTQINKYVNIYEQINGPLNDRTFEGQTEMKRRGKREFIPATSFFITVIGVQQRKKEKEKEEERESKRKQSKKVNKSQKRLRSAESQVKK